MELFLAKFYKLILDSTKKCVDFYIIGDTSVVVEFEDISEFAEASAVGNIFVAVFTICWARLRLYDVLDAVGQNCLYYDTDSVIYKEFANNPLTETGNYLGDLTSELGHEDYIEEFISTRPKSYAYRTNKGETVAKVKGCSLNYRNSQSLNFDTMKHIILDDPEGVITTAYPHKICRRKKTMEVTSKPMTKRFRLVYTKRVVQPDLDTLPFGY